MAGDSTKSPYSEGAQAGALILVVVLSAVAGILIGLLAGYHFPKIGRCPGFNLKPLLTKFKLPPIIGMIFMGCIVRNFFGDVVKPYPTVWAQWLRYCCLAVLLVRGGLQVSFAGKGLIVLFMSFLPQLIEATIIALVGLGLFGMPIEVCFCLGFAIASVAPAIIVPQLMRLNDQGWGRAKGISGSLIASCTFDNIICLIIFGIVNSISFDYADREKGHPSANIGLTIGMLFIHNLVGLAIGVLVGLGAWFFKFIRDWKYQMYAKCAYCFLFGIAFIIAGEESTFTNAKYLACLSLGYVCNRFWGTDKPAKELAKIWFVIQPCLFGTIGAALLFSQINGSDVGKAFACIICGIVLRVASVILMTHSKKFTMRERIFMGIAWIPKSTVPATLAGVVYNTAKARGAGYEDYITYGLYIQTTTILSICFCEPLGSWAIDQFAPKLLQNDIHEKIKDNLTEDDKGKKDISVKNQDPLEEERLDERNATPDNINVSQRSMVIVTENENYIETLENDRTPQKVPELQPPLQLSPSRRINIEDDDNEENEAQAYNQV